MVNDTPESSANRSGDPASLRPEHESLADALRSVETPKAGLLELTGQTLGVRLYGTPALHRVLPTSVALRLAALRGRIEWIVSARRRTESLRFAETMLGLPATGRVARQLARRRLVEEAIQAELQWRPWLWTKLNIEGLGHLQTACALRGGRVVIATLHLGPYLGVPNALAARGLKLYLSQGDWSSESALHGRRGRWTREQSRWLEEAGSRWISRGGSYRIFKALLERDQCCFFAVDVPGDAELLLGGRPVRVRTGPASLALDTGAPILPALTLRRGGSPVGKLFEPLDPVEFNDPIILTQRVLDVFGPALAHELVQVEANLLKLFLLSAGRAT